jgi:hypothetical protein
VDGKACPTVRDFSLVDQDQSDNVTTRYVINAAGQTSLPVAGVAATMVANPSDNRLLSAFVDPALGCVPAAAPSLSSPGTMESSQAMDEIQAMGQVAPVALVPPNDPMTTVGADIDIIPNDFPTAGNLSAVKTDLYRSGVGQPLVAGNLVTAASQYCMNLTAAGTKVAADAVLETGKPGPFNMDLGVFMTARYAASLVLLNCKLFAPGTATPVPAPTATATPAATPTVTPAVTPSVTPTVTPAAATPPATLPVTDSPTDTPVVTDPVAPDPAATGPNG